MSGINRVVLVGRLTRDVEVRKTQSGLSVASYTVAVDRGFRASANGPSADFINCVSWRQSADFLGSYGRKGAMVGIDGSIQTRNYVANDGHKVYVTEVVTDQVQLLESKAQTQERMAQENSYSAPSYSQPSYSQPNYSAPVQQAAPSYSAPVQQAPVQSQPQPASNNSGTEFDTGSSMIDLTKEDLPF